MARKILLADDSVTAQNMGRKILTDAGYEVVTVNNGSAALKRIAEQKPDLIVLDVYMPGYSGLEVCQRIKENRETARIPILLTVGKLEPFKPEEARRARADAFVVKPFEASELLTALTRLEDKIVPQPEPYKQGRFAKAAATIDDESGEKDIGWKERLRIPTGSKKDTEPAIDYVATQGKGIPDLQEQGPAQKPQSKAGKKEKVFERPMPAGLPADITPEEIAAITAAAAQLNGTPNTEETAVPPPQEETSEVPALQAAPEEAAPVTFASAPDLAQDVPQSAGETPAAEPEGALQAVSATVASPEQQAEAALPVPATVPVVETTSDVAEASTAVAPAQDETPVAEPVVEAAHVPPAADSSAVESKELPQIPAEPPSVTQQAPAPPPPADDDVMAALQTLIPATVSDPATTAGPFVAAATVPAAMAGIHAAASAIGSHSTGPRWIAEEVALDAGEAAASLEREMEQVYATAAVAGTPVASAEAEPVTTVSTSANVIETVGQVMATAVEQAEPSVAYAMASAAGVGDAVPVAVILPSVAEIAPAGRTEAVEETEDTKTEELVSATSTAADEAAAPMADTEAAVIEAAVAAPDMTESPANEGADEMAANWKNIRDSIAGAAPKRAPAKEEAREPETTQPEATAHTASPDNGSQPAPAADPRAIASIVDSVLAELRPKIVEEIARKLVEPKKE